MALLGRGVYNGNRQNVTTFNEPSWDIAVGSTGISVVSEYQSFGGTVGARGLYYQGGLFGGDAPAATPEPDTYVPFLVRIPFKGLGQNRYLQNTAQDFDAPVTAEEPSTLAQFLVRIPFKGFGRSPYLQNTTQDLSVVEPLDLPHYLVRIPFKALGRNPYLWNTAQDLSFVEPFDLPSFLAKPQFKALGRNPYLWRTAQDFDAPPPPVEPDTLAQFLVRLNIRGQWWIVPAYVFNLAPQDEDAPPIVVPTGGTFIPTFRTRRGR